MKRMVFVIYMQNDIDRKDVDEESSGNRILFVANVRGLRDRATETQRIERCDEIKDVLRHQ